MTVEAAAVRLDRHPNLVRRWLREGRLRGEKFGQGKGGTWMISEHALSQFERLIACPMTGPEYESLIREKLRIGTLPPARSSQR